MDHKSFETNMIDFVNRHSQAEEINRGKAIQEQRETAAHQKRKKATAAVIEYLLWVAALISIVMVMSFVGSDLIPAKVAIPIASLFAFIAGARINTLSIRITKYGGR
jgi:hypothetical protein